MRVLFTALLPALSAAALPASAGDLDLSPPAAESAAPAKPDWTGFYIGVSGGLVVDDDSDVRIDLDDSPGTPTDTEDTSASKVFGAQVGYDLQLGDLVVGAGADVQKAD